MQESTEDTTVFPLTEVDLSVPLGAALKDLVALSSAPESNGDIVIPDPSNQSQGSVGANDIKTVNEGMVFNLAQCLPGRSLVRCQGIRE